MAMIAHASLDEHGNIKGGNAGDQTGKEVCIRSWYNRPWNVTLRFHDPDMREKCAYAMERAAANNNIGYDQNQRNSLLKAARAYGYDPGKVTTRCETDCSALVTLACIYAGIAEEALVKSGNSATTSTLKSRLKATGEIQIFTTPAYTAHTDKLIRGDILLYEGHHTAVVVQPDSPKKSVSEVAREVLSGKWGNGAERRERLESAGYSYAEVQQAVNVLIHGSAAKKEISKEDRPRYIWHFLLGHIQNPYGVAGLMGNLRDESGLNPRNLQNSYEKKLGFTDDSYTTAVDSGAYLRFNDDLAGYGLAQWTSKGRKKALNEYRKKRSIGDLDMQLEFIWVELSTSYKNVLNRLKTATSVREASDVVLTKYERPKDQSVAAQVRRASFGQEYYDKFFVV